MNMEEAERTLRRAYRQDVLGVVVDYIKELGDDITSQDDSETWLHQTIDGHSRVIYTAQAIDTLRWSENDNAGVEDFGTDGLVADEVVSWSLLAFCAFQADVREQIELWGLSDPSFDDAEELTAERNSTLDDIRKAGWKV